MKMNSPNAETFKKIKFGEASAEAERALAPRLIEQGYWDIRNAVEEAATGHRFLFLGYKGSGKSFLGERLSLRHSDSLLVRSHRLADFPYQTFKSVAAGGAEPQSRYPTAWAWLLLLKLLESLFEDQGAVPSNPEQSNSARSALTKMGLLPGVSLKELTVRSTKNSFRAQIPTLLEIFAEEELTGIDLQFSHLIDHLEKLVLSFSTATKHLIVIDGLDDILTKNDVRLDSLGALIYQSELLNQKFQSLSAPLKIIILCRTELYEKLPNPNKNKTRQVYADYLDWYQNTRDPAETLLVQLANKRAKLADSSIGDIFSEFFPPKLDGLDTVEFLLRQTRHTPRDFLQLLAHIQNFCVSVPLDRNQILAGIRDYSLNYFRPEIVDELNGYFSVDDIQAALSLIGSLSSREFTSTQVLNAANGSSLWRKLDIDRILNALFDCSAIGNVQARPGGGGTFLSFKFRNRNSVFNRNERILLHSGLWKAMNLI